MEIQYEIVFSGGISQTEYQINKSITVFSLLEGHANLIFEGESVELKKGELYVMNFGKLYSMEASSDTIIAMLQVDYEDLMQASGKKSLKFYCDTFIDATKNHYLIKKAFSKLLRSHVMGENKFEEKGYFYNLLSILMKEYVRDSVNDDNWEDDRMYQARKYLHTHFKEKITLEDICNQFYFSVSTFTRNFKKQTNQSMIQYLNGIRIHEAKRLLLEKEKSVTDVALEVGFLDTATFTKTFKKVTGISPLQFRQTKMKKNHSYLGNQELMKMVEKTFLNNAKENRSTYYENEISVFHSKSYSKSWSKVIGIQDAHCLLSYTYCQDLIRTHDKIYFEYVRIPFLLDEDILVKKNHDFDYSKVDQILDFLLENKISPLIELSGRVQNVITHATILGIKEESYYNFSKKEYMERVQAFLSHVFYRYASSIADWKWEIQYERTIFSFEEYVSIFHTVSKTIHAWEEDQTIGGYGMDIYDWKEEEIQCLQEHSYLPDYFSVNVYPYRCVHKQDSLRYVERLLDTYYLQIEMKKLRSALDKCGYENIPVFVTNWNTTFEKQNMLNDSFVKPVWMLGMISCLFENSDLFVYDTFQDEKEGNSGLVIKQGIDKSSFHVLYALSKLGKQILFKDDKLIVSKSSPYRYTGICFNRKHFNMSYYQKEECKISYEDIRTLFDDQDILEQVIRISNIRRIREYIISEEKSILEQRKKMTNNTYLGKEELEFIQNQTTYDMRVMEKSSESGILQFTLFVKPNEMVWFEIFPVQWD
ncbi:MAG: AraC family transcriptional regulator [Bacillota bacterium]|nr:AraC family transcriptional regulator [Bacillota bacterium]